MLQELGNNENAQNSLQIMALNQINIKPMIQCRICLDISTESEAVMISPCKCQGTVKYVHEECLQSWIEKIVSSCSKKIGNGKAHVTCQLCHSNISFTTQKKIECKTRTQIKDTVIQRLKNLILLILLLLVNAGFFFALLDYLIKYGFNTLLQNNAILVSFIISGQVIMSIVALTCTFFIIKIYFLKYSIKVSEIKAYQQILLENKNKKMPKQIIQG